MVCRTRKTTVHKARISVRFLYVHTAGTLGHKNRLSNRFLFVHTARTLGQIKNRFSNQFWPPLELCSTFPSCGDLSWGTNVDREHCYITGLVLSRHKSRVLEKIRIGGCKIREPQDFPIFTWGVYIQYISYHRRARLIQAPGPLDVSLSCIEDEEVVVASGLLLNQ